MAHFCETGREPSHREAFIIAVMNGSSTSIDSFSKNVGTGSRVQDFVGDDSRTRRTTSSLQICSSDNDDDDVENDAGSGQ